MAETFQLEIATPERMLVNEQVIRCQIPCKDGYLGVLPQHAPLLSELDIGVLTYLAADGERRFALAIHGGFVEVLDNHVRVLADLAEYGHEIDLTKAQQELRRAEDQQIDSAVSIDIASALTAIMHARARVEAARRAAANQE
ncbi:MAG TPA: ATP synthase F1 subunit epsilon [Bryobacteraceae bacterium]|nr:ATP synthase F1 subunit epsilon [Bryobacteraceae bacterium]